MWNNIHGDYHHHECYKRTTGVTHVRFHMDMKHKYVCMCMCVCMYIYCGGYFHILRIQTQWMCETYVGQNNVVRISFNKSDLQKRIVNPYNYYYYTSLQNVEWKHFKGSRHYNFFQKFLFCLHYRKSLNWTLDEDVMDDSIRVMGRDYLEDLGVDVSIILKWIVNI